MMKSRFASVLSCGLFAIGLAKGAAAQTAEPAPPPPTVVSDSPPESAFLLQARMQTQQSILSIAGATPGFLLGYQLKGVAVGVGFGFTRAGITTSNDGDSASGTLFHVSPTVIVDVWESRDRHTRANLVGSVGYGRASLSTTSSSSVCSTDATGVTRCTTDKSESKASATLIPVQIGFGGDHFLGRHFGIGAEAGLQLMFISGLESNGRSLDGSANAQAVYGLLRMTLLIGE